jgi:hypothetical protein
MSESNRDRFVGDKDSVTPLGRVVRTEDLTPPEDKKDEKTTDKEDE